MIRMETFQDKCVKIQTLSDLAALQGHRLRNKVKIYHYQSKGVSFFHITDPTQFWHYIILASFVLPTLPF